MEWGDNGLIIEAAVTKAFDFKDGSPQDKDYWLRLNLVKKYLQSKRVERLSYAMLIHDLLICIQRTTAHSEDVYGDKVKYALMRYMELVLGMGTENKLEKPLSEAEQIEIYKERYRQEYGIT